MFSKNGSTWTQQARLLASDGAESSCFDNSVAISDEPIVVGAGAWEDGERWTKSGSAYVFPVRGSQLEAAGQAPDLRGAFRNDIGQSSAVFGETNVVALCQVATAISRGARECRCALFEAGAGH